MLAAGRGRLTPARLRDALRDHYGERSHRPEHAPDDERYFSVCMHADPVGTTTASMIARLPADGGDLLRYWGSLGSPCVSVFLPYYVDGDLPEALARGGAEASADSPWWRFKTLLGLVERDWPLLGPQVRAYWGELERVIDAEAAEVEAKVLRLRRAGERDAGSRLLSRFMAANVGLALERLERLIGELGGTPVGER
jgi:dipeptidase